jgi:hypothetical protein
MNPRHHGLATLRLDLKPAAGGTPDGKRRHFAELKACTQAQLRGRTDGHRDELGENGRHGDTPACARRASWLNTFSEHG